MRDEKKTKEIALTHRGLLRIKKKLKWDLKFKRDLNGI